MCNLCDEFSEAIQEGHAILSEAQFSNGSIPLLGTIERILLVGLHVMFTQIAQVLY